MASAVASKRGPLTGLVNKLLASPSGAPRVAYHALRPASVAGARGFFSFGGSTVRLSRKDDNDEEQSSGSEDDRSGGPAGDVVDKLEAPWAFLPPKEDGEPAVARTGPGWWVAMENKDEVLLKVAMPDLGKEHVKVWADQNTLVVKGEREKSLAEDLHDGVFVRYKRRIELPADAFKMDQIQAEMKNGLLRITVPKVKDEERMDVLHVAVK